MWKEAGSGCRDVTGAQAEAPMQGEWVDNQTNLIESTDIDSMPLKRTPTEAPRSLSIGSFAMEISS